MGATIRLEMFDGLRVWLGEALLLDDPQTIPKHWQLLCLLALQPPGDAVPAAELAAVLWSREGGKAMSAALEEAVGRLNSVFAQAGLEQALVLEDAGSCQLNPQVELDVDSRRFEQVLHNAERVTDEARAQLLLEAMEIYKGTLLPQLENESWVALQSRRYQAMFGQAALALCEGLYQSGQFNALLAAATDATVAEPLEERLYVYIFRALEELRMPRAIIPAYNRALRLFGGTLGRALPQEMEDIYARACSQVDTAERDMLVIKDELRTVGQENISKGGPLFCTYDVFKYLYQMLARTSQRTGSQVVVVLMSIEAPRDGEALPTRAVASAMNLMKAEILEGALLRRSDAFTRYSLNQYLVMLSVDKTSAAEMVVERLRDNLEPLLDESGLRLKFTVAQLDPA